MRVALLLGLLGCWGLEKNREQSLDAASFRTMLQCASLPKPASCTQAMIDEGRRIERVEIEPTDHGSARYLITWSDRSLRSYVNAEFPGKITDELTAARIPYRVK